MREKIVERFYDGLFNDDNPMDRAYYLWKMDEEIYEFMEELFKEYKEDYIDDDSLANDKKCEEYVVREFFLYCAKLIKEDKNIEFDAEDFANFCWRYKHIFYEIGESCGEEAEIEYIEDRYY